MLNFLYGDKGPFINGLRHSLLGLCVQLIIFLIFGTFLYGAIFVTGFYFGRERRDYEIHVKLPTRKWYKGWNIFKWSSDELIDLIPVSVLTWLIYLLEVLL